MKNKLLRGLYILTTFFFISSNIFSQTITNVSTDSSACTGATIVVSFVATGFPAGTIFGVALSDPDGSIPAIPNIVGNGISSPISINIPSNAISATTYSLIVGAIVGTNISAVSLPFSPFEIIQPIAGFTSLITANSLNICANTNVDFTATLSPSITGATFTWFLGSTSVAGQTQSTFSTSSINANTSVHCEVVAPAGCITDNTSTSNTLNIVALTSGLELQATATASDSVICVGRDVTLSASIISGSGNLIYNWSYKKNNVITQISSDSSTITTNIIEAGALVQLTITSDAACLTSNPLIINVPLTVLSITATPPQITLNQIVTYCGSPTDTGVFKVTPILQQAKYYWYIDDFLFDSLKTTLYLPQSKVLVGQKIKCKIVSLNECVIDKIGFSNAIAVEIFASPDIKITEPFTMNYGEKDVVIEVSGPIQAQTILWTPSGTNYINNANAPKPTITPTRTQEYIMHAIASNGCKVEEKVLVTVVPDSVLFLPDIFSPNDDGRNDIYYCRNAPNQIIPSTFLMRIFDESGKVVFESNYQNYGWDGNFRNQPCAQGAYTYYVYGVYFDSSEFEKSGKFILIR
jgi:gliding motility-associated-like protein